MNTALQIFLILAVFAIFVSVIIIVQTIHFEKFIHQEIERHLIVTETILLTEELQSKDYLLLMDITPWLSEAYGHVTIKVPCGPLGEQRLEIIQGVIPDLSPVEMEYVESLSNPPTSCLYQGDISRNVTTIALINTSEESVKFSVEDGPIHSAGNSACAVSLLPMGCPPLSFLLLL